MRVNVNRCPSGQLQSQNRKEILVDGWLVAGIHNAMTRGVEDLDSQDYGGGLNETAHSGTAQLSVAALYAFV